MQYSTQRIFEPTYFDHLCHIQDFTKEFILLGAISIIYCIQGVPRLEDITAGGDFLGLCDQNSSYKHVSDFGRLRSYGHFFNSRTRHRVNSVSRNQLAGDVLNLVAYLLRCQRYFPQLTCAVHNQAAASVAAGGGIFENQL